MLDTKKRVRYNDFSTKTLKYERGKESMTFLPDPKELKFGVGGLRQQYDKMKKVGRCPYDSFEEYMRDFLPELPPEEMKKTDFGGQCEKVLYDAFNSELTKGKRGNPNG